eukprot:TRINITY_DN11396_c0_g1_i1.p1 TRINITY_DN11396_c0_g1~~TRINITY_DN11396_c0_g1_i1.p1  ORF type:complete len:114 (+),score=3.70 TRINITY_DN11396_c0_g1_i1:1-342(+)
MDLLEWESDWLAATSNHSNVITLTHNRNRFPKRGVTVLFSPTNPPGDTIHDVSISNFCAQHGGNNSAFMGTYSYTVNTVVVPLWDGGVIGRFWEPVGGWQTWKSGFLKFIVHF